MTQNKPVAYVPFETEGHYILSAGNIKLMFEHELSFYAQVLGIQLPDQDITPVEIKNFSP